MQTIDFYFDPSCPFCWITSRWLIQVSAHREIAIRWRPFSLALKNDELVARDDESEHAANHRGSHRVLRVIAAASESYADKLLDMYTLFGIKFHLVDTPFDDAMIRDVLADLELPSELARAADDETYDKALHGSMQSALDIVGNDVGVPLIVFALDDDSKQGYFGPVLNELPELEESLQIWDGLSKLATTKSFYELKRSRPGGDPDVVSTALC